MVRELNPGKEAMIKTLLSVISLGALALMTWCASSQLTLMDRISDNEKEIAIINGNRFTASDAIRMMQETQATFTAFQDKVDKKLDTLTSMIYHLDNKLGAE